MSLYNTELFLINFQRCKYNQYLQTSPGWSMSTARSVTPSKVQEHEISPETSTGSHGMCWFHSPDPTQSYLACTVNYSHPQRQGWWCATQDDPMGEVKSQGRAAGALEGHRVYQVLLLFWYLLCFVLLSPRAHWSVKNAQSNQRAPLS